MSRSKCKAENVQSVLKNGYSSVSIVLVQLEHFFTDSREVSISMDVSFDEIQESNKISPDASELYNCFEIPWMSIE